MLAFPTVIMHFVYKHKKKNTLKILFGNCYGSMKSEVPLGSNKTANWGEKVQFINGSRQVPNNPTKCKTLV